MKINVLDKKLFSMISAGEVVEKPASVVKELVENSIDAGATQITIEVEEGGINSISITDNGSGIEKDEVARAFLPHATSKIAVQADLDAIATLGFRGEALSSIQAVSEVILITKTAEAEVGTELVMSGGEVQGSKDCAFNQGTKIVVKNLFFNTPARKKFLNRPKIEENEITKIVERFMLSYPNIKFKYITNGKLVYNTLGTNLFDNIFLIYGQDVASKLIKLDFQEGDYRLEGYISKPEITKPNKSFIVSFINGRMVKDSYMENAIMFAYQDYLMHGNFPICFLNFKIPFENVDVNIHPSKQEVKYENNKEITTFFIKALQSVLEKSQCQKFDELFGIKQAFNLQKEALDFKKEANIISSSYGISYKKDSELSLETSPNEIFNVNLNVDQEDDSYDMDIKESVCQVEDMFEKSLTFEQTQETFIDDEISPAYKIVGTAFNTYIFLEVGEKLLVIDQHACHERKLYDSFLKQIQDNQICTQVLLYPYSFKTSTEEATFFLGHLDAFLSLGINIIESGPNLFRIIEVPSLVRDIDFKDFILSIKQNLNGSKLSIKSLLKDFLAMTACKSAVKAGDKLSDEDIKALLQDLDNHKILRCPHGRPFVYEIPKREIEKWFKRIV